MQRLSALCLILSASFFVGCSSLLSPNGDDAVFALEAVSFRSLPDTVVAQPGGPVIELTGGSLLFDSFGRGFGTVRRIFEYRATSPDGTAEEHRTEDVGTFVRQGASLQIHYESGAWDQYAIEDGGNTLTIEASRCARGVACLAALIVYRYQRTIVTSI